MKLRIFQIDAFSERLFGGNPAAVVPLPQWLPDRTLQAIAAENNLSETAFFTPGENGSYRLRWFTPVREVDLCGHATLAAAWVVFHELGEQAAEVRFETRSGTLRVARDAGRLELDLPARPGRELPLPPRAASALGIGDGCPALLARDLVVVLDSARAVRELQPDFAALARLEVFAVCVTAPGEGEDFVYRFFAPRQGIDEDPVTGSACSTLVPWWAARLGRGTLDARQLSHRGGRLKCRLDGDRVRVGGHARRYLSGDIFLDGELEPGRTP